MINIEISGDFFNEVFNTESEKVALRYLKIVRNYHDDFNSYILEYYKVNNRSKIKHTYPLTKLIVNIKHNERT